MSTQTLAAIDVERFGEQIWDLLIEAGHRAAPEGTGKDGFDVLKPSQGPADHVAVVARCDGLLSGLGTPPVRRARLYALDSTLTDAGHRTAWLEKDGVPLALIVPFGERTAEQIIAEVTS